MGRLGRCHCVSWGNTRGLRIGSTICRKNRRNNLQSSALPLHHCRGSVTSCVLSRTIPSRESHRAVLLATFKDGHQVSSTGSVKIVLVTPQDPTDPSLPSTSGNVSQAPVVTEVPAPAAMAPENVHHERPRSTIAE